MDKDNSGLSEEARRNLQEFLQNNGFDILPELEDEDKTTINNRVNKAAENRTSKKEGEAKKASPKSVVSETTERVGGLSKEALENLKQFMGSRGIGTFIDKIFEPDEVSIVSTPRFQPKISEEERIAAYANEIHENLEKQFALEDEQLRFEAIARKEREFASNVVQKAKKTIQSYRGRTKTENYEKPERLTEPKKRGIIGRTINRKKYDSGWMDYLEDAYLGGEITQEEVDESKNAERWMDRSLYRRVQAYEDAVEDISIKRGWTAFKAGLLTLLLAGSLVGLHWTNQEVKKWDEAAHRVVTVENAREDERTAAMSRLLQVAENTDYEFANLTEKQMLDAALRIPVIEKTIPEGRFKGALNRMEDQKLLEDILVKTYGEDLEDFSPEQIRDLKQLAYEFLDEDIQQWYMRDPQVVDAIARKQNEADREIGD